MCCDLIMSVLVYCIICFNRDYYVLSRKCKSALDRSWLVSHYNMKLFRPVCTRESDRKSESSW